MSAVDLLHVISGRGLICTDGGLPQELEAGTPCGRRPGSGTGRRWPRATVLLHLAMSLGVTNWLGEVTDAEYTAGR